MCHSCLGGSHVSCDAVDSARHTTCGGNLQRMAFPSTCQASNTQSSARVWSFARECYKLSCDRRPI